MKVSKFNQLVSTFFQRKKPVKGDLQYALNILSDIDYINNGGCGFAAYAIYLYLKKHNMLPEDFKIVYFHMYSKFDYDNNRQFLEGNNDCATSCTHAVVYMNGGYLDSYGVYDDYEDFTYELQIKPDAIDIFMQNSLSQLHEWNPLFEREIEVPKIEKELGIKFNV